MRNLRLITAIFLLLPFTVFAKRSMNERKMERRAESHYEFSEYDEALPIFIKLLEQDPSNAKYCYRIGICYYYSATSRPLSVPYFERAMRLPGMKKNSDLLLHAGLAYLSVNRFNDAKACFELFRAQADASYDPTVAPRMIAYCENGEKAWAHPARVRVRNLGRNVNSDFPDYAPVLTNDEAQLLFTSKRPGTTGGRKDDEGYYYEDIYQSKNLANHKWAESGRYDSSYLAPKLGPFRFFFARAENVSEINTNDHDGSIAMSPVSNDLFIYRYGDIWQAGWNGNRWEKPKRMHEEIDAKASVEPSLCFSPDGKTLYFISDRKGGLGGKDIWKCTKQNDGSWGAPENLGPKINTSLNEESPFVSKDGSTLFFSSEGHNSMGGYDVFRSALGNDGEWKSPENLGAPVNNGGDDVFYSPDASGNSAYYSTLNRYGEGDLDLYSVMNYPEVQPMAKLVLPKELAHSELELKVVTADKGEKTYRIKSGDSIVYAYVPGSTAVLTYSSESYRPATDTFRFDASPYNNCLQQLNITSGTNGTSLAVSNYYFDIDFAVDADTVLDLMADRKKARTVFLDELSAISNVYTAWTVDTRLNGLWDKNQPAFNVSINGLSQNKAAEQSFSATGLAPILFDFNESFLRDDMKGTLDAACAQLKKDPTTKLRITGYADSKGSPLYNLQLSRRRAIAVRDYFIICGIAPARLFVTGEGESLPVAPNTKNDGADNPEGRSLNRRVEIQLVR